MSNEINELGNDILDGADEIALFIFGTTKKRRRVYNLAEAGELLVFRLGSSIHARKSALLDWIQKREAKTVSSGIASSDLNQ